MNTFLFKKRVALMATLVAFVVTFGTPQTTHAQSWGDNPASQILKTALEEMTKIIADIQQAVVLVVLIQSVSRQIDQIIEASGGAIVGTQGWVDYLNKANDVAATKARNILGISTRGAVTNYTRGEGDSITGRIADFADAGLLGDEGVPMGSLSPNDYLRNGNGGTISKITGKSELNNIAALTATLNASNNVMAQEVAAGVLRKEKKKQEKAFELSQTTTSGYTGAQPLRVAGIVNNLNASIISTTLGASQSNLVKRIVSVALTQFIKNASGTVEKKINKEVKRSVGKVLNDSGGSQQFKVNF